MSLDVLDELKLERLQYGTVKEGVCRSILMWSEEDKELGWFGQG